MQLVLKAAGSALSWSDLRQRQVKWPATRGHIYLLTGLKKQTEENPLLLRASISSEEWMVEGGWVWMSLLPPKTTDPDHGSLLSQGQWSWQQNPQTSHISGHKRLWSLQFTGCVNLEPSSYLQFCLAALALWPVCHLTFKTSVRSKQQAAINYEAFIAKAEWENQYWARAPSNVMLLNWYTLSYCVIHVLTQWRFGGLLVSRASEVWTSQPAQWHHLET